MAKVRFSYWVIGMVLITSGIALSILSTIPPFASLTMLNVASAANALLVPLGIILSMGSRDTSAVHFWMAIAAGIAAAIAVACAFAWWVARYPAKWSLCELYCQSLQGVVAP